MGQAGANDDSLERLKALLLHEERAELARLAHARETLPKQLPKLLERAHREGRPGALAKALSEPIADALGSAIETRRQSIVDALFPVIMPAIRRAIAEYLRTLSADLNRVVESKFTLRGLRWSLEARRRGLSYAEVALQHTLRYQIDHLFLIQRGSGLVLQHHAA